MSRLNTIIVVTRKHGMNGEERGGGEGIPFCQKLRLQVYLVLISEIS